MLLAVSAKVMALAKVMIAAVAEEFRLSNGKAVSLVTLVMLVLGTASALSFTPLEWNIAGEPVLDVIDRVAGGNVIIFSVKAYCLSRSVEYIGTASVINKVPRTIVICFRVGTT